MDQADTFDNAPLGIFRAERDGGFVAANPALASMLGYHSPEDLIAGVAHGGEHHWVRSERRLEFDELLEREGAVSGFEMEACRKDGSMIWVSMSARLVAPGQGEPSQIEGFVLDVTERREAEEELSLYRSQLESTVLQRSAELAESNRQLRQAIAERQRLEKAQRQIEASYRSMVELSPDVTYRLDHTGRIVFISSAVRAFGYAPAELVGRPFAEIVHFEDVKAMRHSFAERRTGDRGAKDIEIRLLRKGCPSDGGRDGHPRVLVSARGLWRTLEDQTGRDPKDFLGTLGMIHDITERSRATEALEVERQRLFSLLDQLPATVHLQAPDYSIRYSNRHFHDLFGEPDGRRCYEVLEGRTEPCVDCPTFRVFSLGEPEEWEWEMSSGRTLQMYNYPYSDVDGSRLVLVLGIDVTSRKRAEEATDIAERKLAEQRMLSLRSDRLRSLGEMAAGIAHELNQPLMGVRGLAEYLLMALEEGRDVGRDRRREKLNLVVEQADRMAHIIEQVRIFARESDRREVQLVQVNDVVRSAIDMMGAQLRSHGIAIELDLADAQPRVSANAFSLEEVLLNLLSNARDAIDECLPTNADVSTPPRILLRTSADGDAGAKRVRIEVIDDGTGIPASDLQKVFDPFFTTKAATKGTGLGLSISKSIVEQFGGTIHVDSTLGQGTTVTVSLPAEDA